jgi:hypothetical protein
MAGYHSDYESAFPAITDVVSGHLDNIVLLYGNSRDDGFRAIGFTVAGVTRRVERVMDVVQLGDDAVQDPVFIGENDISSASNPGDEVFEIQSNRDETLIEYGFAVPQDGIYVGLQTGDGSPITGLQSGNNERFRGFGSDDLDTYGGVLSNYTGVDAPTYDTDANDPVPTTALSPARNNGVFRIDSKQNGANRFFFMFNNQSGSQKTIDLIALGATYNVKVAENPDETRDMLFDESVPSRVVQYGGFDNTNPNLPRNWSDSVAKVKMGELSG